MLHTASDLEESILRTLCWFSVFNYPLTAFEVWKWLIDPSRPYELVEVYRVLEVSPWLAQRFHCSDGYYMLAGCGAVAQHVETRHERFLDAVRKFKKLRRASLFFQLLPGVRAVGAVNTLAWWHTKETSDIDLFIVTKPGFIWSTRFFLVIPFALLGMRPHHHSEEDDGHEGVLDPFCFSFFATRRAIQLESLRHGSLDYYLAFWTKSIVPIFDKDQVFDEVSRINTWTDRVLPNGKYRKVHHAHAPAEIPALPIQMKLLEPWFRWFQQRRFPESIRSIANVDSRVVVTDDMLKFHENDRRAQFMSVYEESLQRYL